MLYKRFPLVYTYARYSSLFLTWFWVPVETAICLGGLTGVEFDKPIVSVRLGKASDGLGMTLAKSNFSNYMSGGSSGYFFMKYFQPKRSQQGQRAMCTPHRMLLTSKLNTLADIMHFSNFFNPPYSCRKQNGDREKKVVSVLRFSL